MSLNLSFNFGRLFRRNERVTSGKVNAIVKGMSAALSGQTGTADYGDNTITPAKLQQAAQWYASGSYSAGTYTAAYTPTVSSYTDGLILAFKAGSANTGAASLDAGPGAKPLRNENGTVLLPGAIASGNIVEVRYNTTLVAGGCWEITSQRSLPQAAVQGAAKKLFLRTDSSVPDSKVTVTADEVVLKDANGHTLLVSSVSLTLDASLLVGLNGFETGTTESSSRWFYIWLICDGTNVRGVFEDAGTPPADPAGPDLSDAAFSGYTYKALVGVVRNDGSSNFVKFYQLDNKVYIAEQTVLNGTTGTTSFTLLSVTSYVPRHARSIRGNIGSVLSGVFSMAVTGDPGTPATIANGTIGVSRGQAGNSAVAAYGIFVNAVPFEIPAFVQTGVMSLHYAMGNTTANHYGLTITGYDL